ncbi:hypothetical protein PI124_g3496 [Phytophthora idaei]|nr:hypothetical protein PI125_g2860 [Phytophthora idaei]KAG3173657.1 hypothetical protein PI126_g710 [Phytophthora idaei]KAG3251877.1 hypothetical protein PI124_g3496 [Phytophthora idaei]
MAKRFGHFVRHPARAFDTGELSLLLPGVKLQRQLWLVAQNEGKLNNENATPLCWTTELVDKLFYLRYKGLLTQFKNVRNKPAVHRGWIAVVKELDKQRGVGVSSRQCQDKMKAMKQQWAKNKKNLNRRGNDTDRPRVNPKNLDTMIMDWGKSSGTNVDTLFNDASERLSADAEVVD